MRDISKAWLLVVALLCFSPVFAQAASVTGTIWSVNIVGLKNEPLGTITLELTDEKTKTCMAGEWKKTRLISSSFQSPARQLETKGYFPTCEVDDQGMTIQLNPSGLCDAYLFLEGKFTAREGRGEYLSEGLGGATPLGTFTAKKQ